MSNNNYNKGPFESTLDRIQKRLPKEHQKPTLKDTPVRKPKSVPPKTNTIKMQDGGIAKKKRVENVRKTKRDILQSKWRLGIFCNRQCSSYFLGYYTLISSEEQT